MSLADKIFVDMCKDILENGTSTEGEKVRPHWKMERVPTRSKNSVWSTVMISQKSFRQSH